MSACTPPRLKRASPRRYSNLHRSMIIGPGGSGEVELASTAAPCSSPVLGSRRGWARGGPPPRARTEDAMIRRPSRSTAYSAMSPHVSSQWNNSH